MIQNSERNASRAIYISFAIVAGLYALLQQGLISALGSQAASPDAFTKVAALFFASPTLTLVAQALVSSGIMVSYLGVTFSIMFVLGLSYKTCLEKNK